MEWQEAAGWRGRKQLGGVHRHPQDGRVAFASTQQARPYEDSTLASLPLTICFFLHPFPPDAASTRSWEARKTQCGAGPTTTPSCPPPAARA